jgi:glycerophosphoryl diester phosphodiesterase
VPTLEEVLLEFPGVAFSIEIKRNSDALIDGVLAILQRCNRMDDGSVVVASFKHGVVTKVRKRAPQLVTSFSIREVAMMLVRAKLPVFRQRKSQRSRIYQVQWKRRNSLIVTKSLVRAVHKFGYEVHVWTVNDARTMRRLLDFGVDAIFTDRPALLRQVIDDRRSAL